jgi:hypothetical protein
MVISNSKSILMVISNCFCIESKRAKMADVEYGYKCWPRRIARFDEVPGCNTCLGCMYLEEQLQAVLSELNSMRLAVKLLYSDSNMAYPASEVALPIMLSHDEVSASNVGQTVKSSH